MGMKYLLLLFIFFTLSVLVLENTGQKLIYRIEEIARNEGYVLETHHMLTTDNYILALHRIPYKRYANKGGSKRPVVLLMHGMFSCSSSFISLGSEESMAYNLADAGFDVWMVNARGTKNSRFHNDLDPDSPFDKRPFFNFTYEEIGLIDLAEAVDFILSMVEANSIHYIGLGAGGTAFLVLNSIQPEYNEKFESAHLLGAVGYQRYFKNPTLISLAAFTNTYYTLWKSIGLVELFPPGSADNAKSGHDVPRYCTGNSDNMDVYGDVCQLVGIGEIMGKSFLNSLVDSELAGTSVKEVAHFGQNIKNKSFRRWDHGEEQNVEIYGSEVPPEYDLSEITVKVTLHYSKADHLVSERDVRNMARDLQNGVVRKVPQDDFQHFDYMFNPDVKELVTDYIVNAISNHNERMLRKKNVPKKKYPPKRHIRTTWDLKH